MPEFTPINAPTKVKQELRDQDSPDLDPVGGPVQQVKHELDEETTEATANGKIDKVSSRLLAASQSNTRDSGTLIGRRS